MRQIVVSPSFAFFLILFIHFSTLSFLFVFFFFFFFLNLPHLSSVFPSLLGGRFPPFLFSGLFFLWSPAHFLSFAFLSPCHGHFVASVFFSFTLFSFFFSFFFFSKAITLHIGLHQNLYLLPSLSQICFCFPQFGHLWTLLSLFLSCSSIFIFHPFSYVLSLLGIYEAFFLISFFFLLWLGLFMTFLFLISSLLVTAWFTHLFLFSSYFVRYIMFIFPFFLLFFSFVTAWCFSNFLLSFLLFFLLVSHLFFWPTLFFLFFFFNSFYFCHTLLILFPLIFFFCNIFFLFIIIISLFAFFNCPLSQFPSHTNTFYDLLSFLIFVNFLFLVSFLLYLLSLFVYLLYFFISLSFSFICFSLFSLSLSLSLSAYFSFFITHFH
ncbi:unnamed protein product [Acanthosepion pharaonis]|uniref:Uncharacterized protein n=1 Tax=Acanthosepion pharaonis TaxID=158019 RepID=A0A812DUD4_ACAPH|nr:unnamed protein product [Sepia pharaonis]